MATPALKTGQQHRPGADSADRVCLLPTSLRERDEEALKLKQRLRAVSRGIERREAPRRIWNRHKGWLGKTVAVIALIAGAAYAGSLYTGWPVAVVLKHAVSFPNCAAAYSVGLAPARRGQPGYWRSHDADQDGIACEWRPGLRPPQPLIMRVR